MSFPPTNAHVVSMQVQDWDESAGTGQFHLETGIQHPLFNTPGVVDVSGMEFAIAINQVAGTGLEQTIASGASTVEFRFGDGGTTATQTASANHLASSAATGVDFSNSRTGGWTTHEAVSGLGTSTTDLDADDWVLLHTIANLTTAEGIGSVHVKVAFIYGNPSAIA